MKIVSSPAYLDSSALAKVYVPEAESEELDEALKGRNDLIVSDLCLTEITSALSRRVRLAQLASREASRIYHQIARDLREGQFRNVDLTPEVHREAERLLMTLGKSLALRASDALHLALAIRSGAGAIITFDRRMSEAAAAIGTIEVVPSIE